MSHIHWVARQNKLEIPRDKAEVNKRQIRESDGRAHDSDTMMSLLCRLLLVRLVDCTVNLSDFYSYRLIGKLTAFLQLQEFSQRQQTWGLRTSTFAARLSLDC